MSDAKVLTPDERRQRNHDEMIGTILQAARDIMREQGVAELSLQTLARRVGMRAPSLYNYFPSKHAIYDALFIIGMRMYRERIEQIFDQHGATWEGLEQVLQGYFAFALENPELYQLLFERPVPGFVPSEAGLAESGRLLDFSYRMTGEAIASGTLVSPVSAEVTTNLLIAIIHGMTAQHLANEPHFPAGSGRFGSLIPVIMQLLRKAWS
jgi:AcrR family transcriptional regulator